MFQCLKCNEIVSDGSRICRKCGSILEQVAEAVEISPPETTRDPVDAPLLADAVREPPAAPPGSSPLAQDESENTTDHWTCANCSASVPNNFGMCWQCQAIRDLDTTVSAHQIDPADHVVDISLHPAAAGSESHTLRAGSASSDLPPIVADAKLVCPKCGTSDVIPNVRVINKNQGLKTSLELIVEGDPSALIFKNAISAQLRANVCGRCGYAELRVNNPAELLARHRMAQNNPPRR